MNDFIKAPFILAGYFLFAPALGFLLKGQRQAQSWVFALMVFMTSWHINKFTIMLDSIETYRGHTKGFEFSLIEILGLALILAAVLERTPGDRTWRWLAPGSGLYLLYCAASWLSILHAPEKIYVVMAGVRFTKALIILLAAFFFTRREEDVHLLLKAFAFTLIVQAGVVLKMKYVDHFYQIRGWFEHQNPLAMWAYLAGLPLLGAAMSSVSVSQGRWYTAGFVASAVIVQGSLSRASLAAFAAGVVMVVAAGLFDGFTRKRLLFITGMSIFGTFGILLAAGTIISRFHDEGNEQSGQTRVVMNLAAKAMLDDSSTGIGWNNFALAVNHPFTYGDVIDDDEREKGHTVDEDYAKGVVESHYWLLLAETGYPGLITYLLFIVVTGWWCLRGMWHFRKHVFAAYLSGLLVGVVLIYFHSSLERVLTQTKNYSAYFLLMGVAARIEVWRRTGWHAPTLSHPVAALAPRHRGRSLAYR